MCGIARAMPWAMLTAGARVRQVRDRLGLSQPELGQLVGAHWVTVSRWERDELTPSPYQMGLIERFGEAARTGKTELGDSVKAAIVTVGVVAALFLLLKAAFNEEGRRGSRD